MFSCVDRRSNAYKQGCADLDHLSSGHLSDSPKMRVNPLIANTYVATQKLSIVPEI